MHMTLCRHSLSLYLGHERSLLLFISFLQFQNLLKVLTFGCFTLRRNVSNRRYSSLMRGSRFQAMFTCAEHAYDLSDHYFN